MVTTAVTSQDLVDAILKGWDHVDAMTTLRAEIVATTLILEEAFEAINRSRPKQDQFSLSTPTEKEYLLGTNMNYTVEISQAGYLLIPLYNVFGPSAGSQNFSICFRMESEEVYHCSSVANMLEMIRNQLSHPRTGEALLCSSPVVPKNTY